MAMVLCRDYLHFLPAFCKHFGADYNTWYVQIMPKSLQLTPSHQDPLLEGFLQSLEKNQKNDHCVIYLLIGAKASSDSSHKNLCLLPVKSPPNSFYGFFDSNLFSDEMKWSLIFCLPWLTFTFLVIRWEQKETT